MEEVYRQRNDVEELADRALTKHFREECSVQEAARQYAESLKFNEIERFGYEELGTPEGKTVFGGTSGFLVLDQKDTNSVRIRYANCATAHGDKSDETADRIEFGSVELDETIEEASEAFSYTCEAYLLDSQYEDNPWTPEEELEASLR